MRDHPFAGPHVGFQKRGLQWQDSDAPWHCAPQITPQQRVCSPYGTARVLTSGCRLRIADGHGCHTRPPQHKGQCQSRRLRAPKGKPLEGPISEDMTKPQDPRRGLPGGCKVTGGAHVRAVTVDRRFHFPVQDSLCHTENLGNRIQRLVNRRRGHTPRWRMGRGGGRCRTNPRLRQLPGIAQAPQTWAPCISPVETAWAKCKLTWFPVERDDLLVSPPPTTTGSAARAAASCGRQGAGLRRASSARSTRQDLPFRADGGQSLL